MDTQRPGNRAFELASAEAEMFHTTCVSGTGSRSEGECMRMMKMMLGKLGLEPDHGGLRRMDFIL